MAYWVGVVSADHVEYAVKHGLCAFSHGKRPPVAKMAKGDEFVFYSPKTAIEDGEAVQCFTAHGTVSDDEPHEVQWGVHRAWARRATFAPFDWLPVRPLLEQLAFVRNPARWGMAFRRGHFEISAKDFGLITTTHK